ncbi:hypothetical protein WJT86_05405 [Microvirga sp. W0021]|uniref:Uncharacterized protein n=1 Tax=Hohaiivirga grylli TaxID=3133970 RepID=A0ABV0BK13_9HYPH
MKLPAPQKSGQSIIIDTYGKNEIPVSSREASIIIRGPDVVVRMADGSELTLTMAAQIASIQKTVFTLVFSDGVEINSDVLFQSASAIEMPPEVAQDKGEETKQSAEGDPLLIVEKTEATQATDNSLAEKTVAASEFIKENPYRQEVTSTMSSTSGTSAPETQSSTTPMALPVSSTEDSSSDASSSVPPVTDAGSDSNAGSNTGGNSDNGNDSDNGNENPGTPGIEIPNSNPMILSLKILQPAGSVDEEARVYLGGAGADGSRTDGSSSLQYDSEVIDLTGETEDWTIHADGVDGLEAGYVSRIILIGDATGGISIRGLPGSFTVIYGDSEEGQALGLAANELYIRYPSGNKDVYTLDISYINLKGESVTYERKLYIVDAPAGMVNSDGDLLMSTQPNGTEIHAGSGNDTIIASIAPSQIYDGGAGVDTVDYSSVDAAIVADLRAGTVSKAGHSVDSLLNIENIIGTVYADTLIGDDNDNVLDGGEGNDRLVGGAGNNTLIGGAGTDTADYSLATAGIVIDLGDGTASNNGYGGTDIIVDVENVTGSNYADIIGGSDVNNYLSGGAGDDTFYGSKGNDTIVGGSGTNTVNYSNLDQEITVNLAAGSISKGTSGTDAVSGITNVVGTNYNDYFLDGTGNQYYNGGAGSDTIDFSTRVNSGGTFTVNLQTGEAYSITGSIRLGDTDTFTSIENIIGVTSQAASYIGNSSDNRIIAGSGNDWVAGWQGNDYLDGGAGIDWVDYRGVAGAVHVDLSQNKAFNDGYGTVDTLLNFEYIAGSSYGDTLIGNSGTNYFYGGAGNDYIDGGAGTDYYYVYNFSNAGVFVDLAAGIAEDGQGGIDTLVNIEGAMGSYNGDNTFRGNSGNNIFYGYLGNDLFYGSGGSDTFYGSSGSDTVNYSEMTANVVVNLTTGKATKSQGGTDTLSAIENVFGSDFDDVITGSVGSNTINGGAGNDRIIGGAGADILIGGDGYDTVDYSTDTAGIIANLAGIVQDGSGSTDTILQFEAIIGSNHNDVFINNSTTGWNINGGAGTDTFQKSGEGGSFTLSGGFISIEVFDFADGKTDNIQANLNSLFADLGAGVHATLNIDAADTFSVADNSGWTHSTVDGNDVWSNSSGGSLTVVAA